MNLSKSIALAILAVGFISSTTEASPLQWTGPGANGHFYMVTSTTMDWTAASALAGSLGGYLASIHSQAENDFLQASFFPTNREAFWIGLTDHATEGSFVWTSGEAVSFTLWHPGEPNNAFDTGPGGEDYVAINWHFAANLSGTRGTWNDLPNAGCSGPGCPTPQLLGAIIEFDTNPVPETSSVLLISVGCMTGFLLYRRRIAYQS